MISKAISQLLEEPLQRPGCWKRKTIFYKLEKKYLHIVNILVDLSQFTNLSCTILIGWIGT